MDNNKNVIIMVSQEFYDATKASARRRYMHLCWYGMEAVTEFLKLSKAERKALTDVKERCNIPMCIRLSEGQISAVDNLRVVWYPLSRSSLIRAAIRWYNEVGVAP